MDHHTVCRFLNQYPIKFNLFLSLSKKTRKSTHLQMSLHWNLAITKGQGTGKICSL